MIRTIGRVIRTEGVASALRRGQERISDLSRELLWHGSLADAPIVNVLTTPLATRFGGVQAQLIARLRVESTMRRVVVRRLDADLRGARVIHLEGTDGADVARVLRLIESGVRVIVTLHDFSLVSTDPHFIRPKPVEPARQLLAAASAVIFPSQFLLDEYRRLAGMPDLAGTIIEPATDVGRVLQPDVGRVLQPVQLQPVSDHAPLGDPSAGRRTRPTFAYAGSVKRHKGAHLLPEIIRMTGGEWHVFGGGDADLLRDVRPLAHVHGYHRRGMLPGLLARHGIDVVVLPSVGLETYGLVLSEVWLAGVPVVAFDHGALAERITRLGGGKLAPLASGTAGIAALMKEAQGMKVPTTIATAREAAEAHVALYRTML